MTTDKPASMHLWLSSSLDQLLQSKELRKQPSLKEKCQKAFNSLKQIQKNPDELFGDSFQVIIESLVESLRHVLRNANVMGSVMDSLQKIMSHPLMSEEWMVGEEKASEMVCRVVCEIAEEVLLAVVTAKEALIHQASLLMVMKTIYNMYLASKQSGQQTMLKGALNQMINAVFERLEKSFQENRELYLEILEMKSKSEQGEEGMEGRLESPKVGERKMSEEIKNVDRKDSGNESERRANERIENDATRKDSGHSQHKNQVETEKKEVEEVEVVEQVKDVEGHQPTDKGEIDNNQTDADVSKVLESVLG
ncbi:hypothetical protein ROZALSC1DRAFT_23481, partial [Rozella allomycis CSF55]